MITIQIDRVIPLPCGIKNPKGFTINNCDFLFLDCSGCIITKWSQHIKEIETINLERKYLCICYDSFRNCYWAVSTYEPYRIYQLDLCFHEIDCITANSICQRPTNLCCDDCGKGIWISYPSQLIFIDICSGNMTQYKNEDTSRINLGAIITHECCAFNYSECYRQILEILSPNCQECIELCLPKRYRLIGICPCPCDCCRFCVLMLKAGSHELVLFEYCIYFSENSPIACSPCHECCEPISCCCCPNPPHCCGKYEVMHSIALEEAGISHILNAEGEKIQKAVAISNNIEQLICVNESVKHTLTQVTLLEGILYSKLEALVNNEDCCHHCLSCPPPCPCHD